MYTIYEMCCDGFDQKLEQQFLKPNRHQKKVYICSPYSDPDLEQQLDNMRRARLYMLYPCLERSRQEKLHHSGWKSPSRLQSVIYAQQGSRLISAAAIRSLPFPADNICWMFGNWMLRKRS